MVGTTTVAGNNDCSNYYLLGSVYLRFSSCAQGTVAENLASRLDPAKKCLQERDRLATSTKVDEDIGFSECNNECPLLC